MFDKESGNVISALLTQHNLIMNQSRETGPLYTIQDMKHRTSIFSERGEFRQCKPTQNPSQSNSKAVSVGVRHSSH